MLASPELLLFVILRFLRTVREGLFFGGCAIIFAYEFLLLNHSRLPGNFITVYFINVLVKNYRRVLRYKHFNLYNPVFTTQFQLSIWASTRTEARTCLAFGRESNDQLHCLLPQQSHTSEKLVTSLRYMMDLLDSTVISIVGFYV